MNFEQKNGKSLKVKNGKKIAHRRALDGKHVTGTVRWLSHRLT